MAGFEYGDPHPSVSDVTARRGRALLRLAAHFEGVAAAAAKLDKLGHESSAEALRRFDREFENIQAGWAWASEHWEASRDAAELCQDFPLRAAHLLDLRLPVQTRVVWLERAVQASRRLGDRKREGRALGNLGLAYKDLGDIRRAIECHERHLDIARGVGDRRGEGDALGNLASATSRLGEIEASIRYSEQALEIIREFKDRRKEGMALGNLGIAYKNLGDLKKAISLHEQHLAIAREAGDRRGEGMALGNLGLAYHKLGDSRSAIRYHMQRITIALEIGDRLGESDGKWNLALSLADIGDFQAAVQSAEESLAYLETICHPWVEEDRATVAGWRDAAVGRRPS